MRKALLQRRGWCGRLWWCAAAFNIATKQRRRRFEIPKFKGPLYTVLFRLLWNFGGECQKLWICWLQIFLEIVKFKCINRFINIWSFKIWDEILKYNFYCTSFTSTKPYHRHNLKPQFTTPTRRIRFSIYLYNFCANSLLSSVILGLIDILL